LQTTLSWMSQVPTSHRHRGPDQPLSRIAVPRGGVKTLVLPARFEPPRLRRRELPALGVPRSSCQKHGKSAQGQGGGGATQAEAGSDRCQRRLAFGPRRDPPSAGVLNLPSPTRSPVEAARRLSRGRAHPHSMACAIPRERLGHRLGARTPARLVREKRRARKMDRTFAPRRLRPPGGPRCSPSRIDRLPPQAIPALRMIRCMDLLPFHSLTSGTMPHGVGCLAVPMPAFAARPCLQTASQRELLGIPTNAAGCRSSIWDSSLHSVLAITTVPNPKLVEGGAI
jgi:hypothetical protein